MCCRLAARGVEIDQLRAEKLALEQRLAEQQSKAAEDESCNAEAIAKLKDSFQLAENAVIERDQVGLSVDVENVKNMTEIFFKTLKNVTHANN